MNLTSIKRFSQFKIILALGLFNVISSAFASTLGGLTKAQTAATDIKTGLFTLVGVIAIIYLIYLGVMAFTEKKSWADFGWGIVYVSLVGASTALAAWAWGLFQ